MQYRHLQTARISFVVVGKTLYQTKVYIKIFKAVQKSNNKIVSKEAPEYDY